MEEKIKESEVENDKVSTLRIVAKREEGNDPYTVNIPVKGDTFSLVLPNGYINWPEKRPYPDSIRVKIDEEKNLWINFNVSKKHGFYSSLKFSENPKNEED